MDHSKTAKALRSDSSILFCQTALALELTEKMHFAARKKN